MGKARKKGQQPKKPLTTKMVEKPKSSSKAKQAKKVEVVLVVDKEPNLSNKSKTESKVKVNVEEEIAELAHVLGPLPAPIPAVAKRQLRSSMRRLKDLPNPEDKVKDDSNTDVAVAGVKRHEIGQEILNKESPIKKNGKRPEPSKVNVVKEYVPSNSGINVGNVESTTRSGAAFRKCQSPKNQSKELKRKSKVSKKSTTPVTTTGPVPNIAIMTTIENDYAKIIIDVVNNMNNLEQSAPGDNNINIPLNLQPKELKRKSKVSKKSTMPVTIEADSDAMVVGQIENTVEVGENEQQDAFTQQEEKKISLASQQQQGQHQVLENKEEMVLEKESSDENENNFLEVSEKEGSKLPDFPDKSDDLSDAESEGEGTSGFKTSSYDSEVRQIENEVKKEESPIKTDTSRVIEEADGSIFSSEDDEDDGLSIFDEVQANTDDENSDLRKSPTESDKNLKGRQEPVIPGVVPKRQVETRKEELSSGFESGRGKRDFGEDEDADDEDDDETGPPSKRSKVGSNAKGRKKVRDKKSVSDIWRTDSTTSDDDE